MTISAGGFQSPYFAATQKPDSLPVHNMARVTYSDLTPQAIKERKVYTGLMYTSGALMISSFLSQPLHKGLIKAAPKLIEKVTQKGLEKTLSLSGIALFFGTAIACIGFSSKGSNENFTLENVDLAALKKTGSLPEKT